MSPKGNSTEYQATQIQQQEATGGADGADGADVVRTMLKVGGDRK